MILGIIRKEFLNERIYFRKRTLKSKQMETKCKLESYVCTKVTFRVPEDADPRRLSEIITDDETWIRYNEPQSKERNTVWVLKGERPPVNPRPDFRDQKVLYSIFFDAHGPVAQIIIPKGSTITGDF